MDTKKKAEKKLHVVNSVPPAKRAVGVKIEGKNPTLIAKADVAVEKLPDNLRAVFEKIASKGRDGEKIRTLYPRNTPSNRYCWWHCRTLIKMGHVRQVPEPKAAAPTKKLTIRKALEKKLNSKKPNNRLAQVA